MTMTPSQNEAESKADDLIEKQRHVIEEKVRDFSDLIKKIDSLDDKKRRLWQEIYENAITDRQNAYAMFIKLMLIVENKSSEHAVHGKTISTYIERMSKANDQLIKLAELIAHAEQKGGQIDPDEMFERINKGR